MFSLATSTGGTIGRLGAGRFCGVCVAVGLIAPGLAALGAADGPVDFASQIRPIISAKCFSCHGPDESSRKAKLRLDLREEAVKERKGGRFAIKPGEADHSELVRRISSADPDEVMPPPKEGHPLTSREVALLKRWIAEGATYTGHWAFTKPGRPTLPQVEEKSWPRNAIDHFILAKLEAAGLKPSPEADRHTLARRLSFDLIGLPPTPEKVDEFVHDPSPDAYEKLVDRLLAAPAYGERWARPWLDLARYADSAGYGSDPLRLNIWPWRDWVINALNCNMPFDRFTLEQLAGDLLPHPTEEQLIATAFHRNTMTNTEGGTDDEEWRVASVKDRVNVTVQAWMGLTMGCAQCHSHKFDPISNREYYQFFALFNQTEDNDQPDERPTLPRPTPEERQRLARLSNEIASAESKLRKPTPELLSELAAWEKAFGQGTEWTVLAPLEAKSASGCKLARLDDDSLLVSGEFDTKDTYTVHVRNALTNLTAIRLEALPHASLPDRGPGRGSDGRFVLSDLRLVFRPEQVEPKSARFVRVALPGKQRFLSLAEVQVFSWGTNVARQGKASQSSTDFDGPAHLAIDGNTDGDFDGAKSTTHTAQEDGPWWEVDLGAEWPLDSITIWNRTGGEFAKRLDGFRLLALDAERKAVWETRVSSAPKISGTYSLSGEQRIALQNPSADYSEKDYGVEKATDGREDGDSGWGAGEGKARIAVFETVGASGPGTLKVTLAHNSGYKRALGRFRLSATAQPRPVRVVPTNILAVLTVAPDARSERQQQEFLQWFRQYAAATAEINAEITRLKKDLAAIKPLGLPIMRELPGDKRRTTRILNKGNFLDPGEVVGPGAPVSFHAWPQGAPSNRLGVAQWLMSPDNPLTARVAANRFWAQIFGSGLVETEEDFGSQGAMPSHPELLDWLAVEFRDGGWNMKQLLGSIVTSATYRQSSRVTAKLLEKDPRNRLLSRFPRRRLDAEMVRDQALALSGLLSRKMGGPSVYPPQPEGLWRAAFNGERTYATSKGEDRYRRGLYTVWRRTIPYPSMATFDAPSRETCTFRRLPTNTPLQAYVTLNDPVYVECAQALARRILREGGLTVANRVRWGLRLVLARPPTDEQVNELVKLFDAELAHYLDHQKDALKLASDPLGPLPEGTSPSEAAAWTVVANVLLNLDGVLTKS
jgi:hypothetical protein